MKNFSMTCGKLNHLTSQRLKNSSVFSMKSTPNIYLMLYFGKNFSHSSENLKFLALETVIFKFINQFPLKMVTKAEFFVKLQKKKSNSDTPNNLINSYS